MNPGERQWVVPAWDGLTDKERDDLLTAILDHLNLSAYRVWDGDAVRVVVEPNT